MANLALQARETMPVFHPVLSPDQWPSAQALMDAARELSGLDDFGSTDFVEALDQLLHSLRSESAIEGPPRTNVLTLLLRRLENRLAVEQWHAAHPEAAQAEVRGPIAITGLPRTGTTALGNLLSLDRQFRPLRTWEQASPVPPPVLAEEMNDPRRMTMLSRLTAMISNDPREMEMHLYDIDATEEDHDVLGLAFAAQHNTWPVPGYRQWWRGADLRGAYAYHRRVLQMLQSSRPPNLWMLKAPHYKFHMEMIAEVYPDVQFVFTHRDPVKSIPSYFSFFMNYLPVGTVERFGKEKLARDMYRHLLEGMHIAVANRERLGEQRFVDVSQRGLNKETIGTLERLYDGLGQPFTGTFADDVKRWQAANHSGAHGSHAYTAQEYGFSEEEIRADFAFYTERFGHFY